LLCTVTFWWKGWSHEPLVAPGHAGRASPGRNGPDRAPRPRYALLINPFYRKDPHASFSKHVLTPTLALTSIAAATPPEWQVRYWDENLLQGPPPWRQFPQVVGITVHLTFAARAYTLAAWYRQRGAKVVFGGLHVLSCPDEARPHADALVIGDGVQVWAQLLRDVEAGRLQPVSASAAGWRLRRKIGWRSGRWCRPVFDGGAEGGVLTATATRLIVCASHI
jgi:hypothetical protein